MNNNPPMYHIHKLGTPYDSLWTPGSTFVVEKGKRNLFLRHYDTMTIGVHSSDSRTIPITAAIQRLKEMPEDIWHQNCRALLDQAAKAVKELGTYIREIIFEEIRRTEFPDHPSRMSCVWFCDAAGIPYWWQRTHSGNKVILEVHATGIRHRANQEFLVSDSISHDELRNYARRYWRGDNVRNQPEEELLFCGEVRVLRQYNDLAAFTEGISHNNPRRAQ